MISLGDKLSRFVGGGPATPRVDHDSEGALRSNACPSGHARDGLTPARESLKGALERLPSPLRSCHTEPALPLDFAAGPLLTLAEAMPGRAISTLHGSTWLGESAHLPSDRHGLIAFETAQAADYRHLERMTGDERLRGFDPRHALFLDIEATGLEHGAGTLAFLVGLGFFEGDALRVEQVLLRDPDEEAALLELVWQAVLRFDYLVSFNGKSFDLSVLQNRMVMHRMCSRETAELKLRPHLDLLHVSRSVFKGVWPDVRLQTLEREVLGFFREDDMPGALAPLCWFTWLRDGDARPLAGIARHNRMDVLSMVALAGLLAREAEPRPDAGRRSRVALNLARLYLRRKAPSEALLVLADLPPLMDHVERVAALELVSIASRRIGDLDAQVGALIELLALAPERVDVEKALMRARRAGARKAKAAP